VTALAQPAVAAPRARLRDLVAAGEYRAIWGSYILSATGDRLALVALALLVYDRTHSPLLSAVAYASGNVPYLVGGLFGAHLADRFPRRGVMISCDLIRAGLTGATALPRMPLYALIGLLYVTTAVQPPFDAARSAIIRDVLDGPRYTLGVTVMQMTFRTALTAGAAVGGVTVALIGARPALMADAVTFVLSALLLRAGVRYRPAAASQTAVPPAPPGRHPVPRYRRRWPGGTATSGIRLVFGDPALRTIVLLGWLAALYEVPEGIVGPYAAAVGGGPAAAGLLIAASQAMVVIAPLYAKLPDRVRERWMGLMAVGACAILILTALRPGIIASAVVLAVVGAGGTYQVTVNTAFQNAIPDARRGQAFGIASTGLTAGQGLAYAVAGWAAEHMAPAMVTAIAGGVGTIIACLLAISWRHRNGDKTTHVRAIVHN
jgi:MFS family permease